MKNTTVTIVRVFPYKLPAGLQFVSLTADRDLARRC